MSEENIDLVKVRGRFKKIEDAVNEAISQMIKTDGSWRDESFNLSRLRCAGAEYVIDEDGCRYVAIIRKADPACPSMHKFVSDYIRIRGFGDVEIATEW